MTEQLNSQPHRRLNILTGEWVLVSPHRNRRPWQGKQEELTLNTIRNVISVPEIQEREAKRILIIPSLTASKTILLLCCPRRIVGLNQKAYWWHKLKQACAR